MRWTKKEKEYLKENYSSNPDILKICKKLKRSRKAINHKAARMEINRKRFHSSKPSKRIPRKIVDKKYYEKHKKEIYKKRLLRRRKLKEYAVKLLGGRCNKCKYNKCPAALDFHHNKGQKEGLMAHIIKNGSKQKILKEVNKCIVLCANCHREIHNTDT